MKYINILTTIIVCFFTISCKKWSTEKSSYGEPYKKITNKFVIVESNPNKSIKDAFKLGVQSTQVEQTITWELYLGSTYVLVAGDYYITVGSDKYEKSPVGEFIISDAWKHKGDLINESPGYIVLFSN